jgi:hypothetical protein
MCAHIQVHANKQTNTQTSKQANKLHGSQKYINFPKLEVAFSVTNVCFFQICFSFMTVNSEEKERKKERKKRISYY